MDTILQTGLSNALVASALALVAVLVGYFYRRPALVHGLWLLVLLKLVTPPLVPIAITWPASPAPEAVAAEAPPSAVDTSDTPVSPNFIVEMSPESDDLPRFVVQGEPEPEPSEPAPEAPAAAAAPTGPFPWQALVAGVWVAGSGGWFLLAGWRVWRFRRLLRFATPAPEALRKMTERLARKMDLTACPAVYLIPGRLAPMLWSIGGKPLLLVPRDLLGKMTQEQQQTLLAHELAHLRRRDHWVRGLEFLVMGLYWWHPVVWYARRVLREAEEQCCDAWVVSLLPGAGKTYATALLETLDFLSDAHTATPMLTSGVGQVSDLKRRLTMIMCGSTPRALTWRGTLAVMALGLFALPLLPTLVNAQTGETQDQLERKLAIARAELAQARDAAQAQAELEKARADLALMQAELQQKAALIRELEAKLGAMKAGDAREAERIRTAAKLKEAKSNKEPTEIILRKVGDKWEIVQPKQPGSQPYRLDVKDGAYHVVPVDPNARKYYRIEEKDGAYRLLAIELKPVPPTTKVPPEQPGVVADPSLKGLPYRAPPIVAIPGQPAPEGRIDNLERQLQQIMKELELLRKEMKQPSKPGATFTPENEEELRRRKAELDSLLRKVEEEEGLRFKVVPPDTKPMPKPEPKPMPKPASN